jgi:hypothetical protein
MSNTNKPNVGIKYTRNNVPRYFKKSKQSQFLIEKKNIFRQLMRDTDNEALFISEIMSLYGSSFVLHIKNRNHLLACRSKYYIQIYDLSTFAIFGRLDVTSSQSVDPILTHDGKFVIVVHFDKIQMISTENYDNIRAFYRECSHFPIVKINIYHISPAYLYVTRGTDEHSSEPGSLEKIDISSLWHHEQKSAFISGLQSNKDNAISRFRDNWMFDKNVLSIINGFLPDADSFSYLETA